MKIKTSLIHGLAVAVLLSSNVAIAGGPTDPVGFHTLTVRGEAFSLLSPGLVNGIEYSSVTTDITATVITVDGTPFAEIDFGAVAAIPGEVGTATCGYNAYYVEITTGPEAGAWANIIANTDNTLTIDRDLSAAGSAETIAIRKHITISDLFGANNEAGLDGDVNGEVANADEVSLFANGMSEVFFYVTAQGLEGWYDAGLDRCGNAAIEPQQAVFVQRKQPGDVEFVRAGFVKVGPTKLHVNPGFNALANPRVVGRDDEGIPVFTLGNSNLWNAADPANSIDASEDGNLSKADQITVFNDPGDPDGPFSVYFYVNVKGFSGWYDAALDEFKNDIVLENGKGFLLNRASGPDLTGTAFIWTVPAEPIAP